MIRTTLSPSRLHLEVSWLNTTGAEKLDVASCTVEVWHRNALGVRVQDLAPTAMTLDAGTGTFQYTWATPALTVAQQHTVEYRATDTAGAMGLTTEDLLVLDFEGKLETVLDVLLGRQKLDANTDRLILFRRDGTILATFDVKNDVGAPSVCDVFERVPVP